MGCRPVSRRRAWHQGGLYNRRLIFLPPPAQKHHPRIPASDTHDEAHTGAIKTEAVPDIHHPGLHCCRSSSSSAWWCFVTSGSKPNAGVGNLGWRLRSAFKGRQWGAATLNCPLRAGRSGATGQCAAAAAMPRAPWHSQAGRCDAWGRIKTGFRALVQSALRSRGHGTARAAATSATPRSRAAWPTWRMPRALFVEPAAPGGADAAAVALLLQPPLQQLRQPPLHQPQ